MSAFNQTAYPLARYRPRSPEACWHCGSDLLQAQSWKELPHGRVMLHLHCPECMSWSEESFDQDRVAAYDEEVLRRREVLEHQYREMVRANMTDLADCFAQALALDLIDADDFRRAPLRAWLQSSA